MRELAGAMVMALALSVAARAMPDDERTRDAIVKIYTVHQRPNYWNPWTSYGPRSSTGSGCIVEGRRILSNAHVVGNQTFIQVRRNGESRRFQARVLAVSHEADLALLEVEDERFFENAPSLEFGPMPATRQEVMVYGFPLGGDTLSVTKGVLSRIEHQTYAHTSTEFLAGQIDAAINPGNSGGPVVVDGRIVGVVMQSIGKAENIGYMVPPPIIQHFLDDFEANGRVDGFPSLGVVTQDMENPALKARYDLTEEQTGVLIYQILPGAPAGGILREGDVILYVDGQPVADDGTVEFRPRERTKASYLVQRRQIGEPLDLTVWREGEALDVQVPLNRSMLEDLLVPAEQYDHLPPYFIYGGIVFCPLSRNLLREWGSNWFDSAPKDLTSRLLFNIPEKEGQEVVLALKVLAADINEGYHSVANWTVAEVNGIEVLNLRHLVELVEQGEPGPFMEFVGANGRKIVLAREEAEAAGPAILATYRIEADRSPDLPSRQVGQAAGTGEDPN